MITKKHHGDPALHHNRHSANIHQVGATMNKTTRSVNSGQVGKTGCSVVGDMVEWTLWVTHANSVVSMLSLWGGGGMYLFRLFLLALSACIIYNIYSMNIIIIVNVVP